MPEQSPLPPPAPISWLRPELVAPWWKIVNVLIVMLGFGIVSGAIYGVKHTSGDFYRMLNDHFFIRDGFFESGFLAAFLFFLRWRGWKPSDFRIQIGWWTSLCGIGLFVLTLGAVYLAIQLAFIVAAIFGGSIAQFILLFLPTNNGAQPGTVYLHWICIFSFVFLNAFYEELIYMGYAFNQWAQKYGAKSAFWLTFAFRMGVHIYQGSEHIVQIAVFSIVFGLWYWRQGKLWPLILAHALIDLRSLSLFKIYFGAHS